MRDRGGPQKKYLPEQLEDDFQPSDEDIDFAVRFQYIADAIDECRNAELVALLLSTCRNQWMTVNGAFVDLQEILGAAHLPAVTSRGFHHFADGESAAAAKLFREALTLRSAISQKLECWARREELLGQLKAAIANPDRKLIERNQLELWLARQSHSPSQPGKAQKAKFLRLDLDDTRCPQHLGTIERATVKLTAALRTAHRLSRVMAVAHEIAGEAVEEAPAEPLFELPGELDADSESDERAERERDLGGAWAKLRETVLAHAGELEFAVGGGEGEGEPIYLEDSSGSAFLLELDLPEKDAVELADELTPALDALMSQARKTIEKVRSDVFESFMPNVIAPPMPAPFVIDLTPGDRGSSDERARSFKLQIADGLLQPPNTPKLALLQAGMPECAYVTTRKDHIAFNPEDGEPARMAKKIAIAAVEEASRLGAEYLAIPEIFLPRAAVDEVVAVAEEMKIGVIAGIEYPDKHGGPINEALIHIPGRQSPVFQRKQGPSVEEANHSSFESTLELYFARRTALGNFGVIVCSDLMELDLLWALASFEDRLDVLVICARNHNTEIFERLAIADAMRLHSFVAVVNSWPPRNGDAELPSGRGTFVAQPSHSEPLLGLEEHQLPIDWEGQIAPPTLAIATLPIAKIRARDSERTGAHGFVNPPRFARSDWSA